MKTIAKSDFSKNQTLKNKSEWINFWKEYGLGTPGSVGGQFPSAPITVEDNILTIPFNPGDWGGQGWKNAGAIIYRSSPEHKGKSIYSTFKVKFGKDFDFGEKDQEFRGGKFGVSWKVGNIKAGSIPNEGNIQITTMWRGGGELHAYLYHSGQGSKYPKPTEPYLYGQVERERWYTFATEIIASSEGKSNGVIRIYLDGKIAWERKDIKVGFDGEVLFEPSFGNFFGGDSNNWQSRTKSNIQYKDLEVWESKPDGSPDPQPDPEPTPDPEPDPQPSGCKEEIDRLGDLISELEAELQKEQEAKEAAIATQKELREFADAYKKVQSLISKL